MWNVALPLLLPFILPLAFRPLRAVFPQPCGTGLRYESDLPLVRYRLNTSEVLDGLAMELCAHFAQRILWMGVIPRMRVGCHGSAASASASRIRPLTGPAHD